MTPFLIVDSLSRIVQHHDRIHIIVRPEILARPPDFLQTLVDWMPRIEASSIPFADEKGTLDRLQSVENFLHLGFRYDYVAIFVLFVDERKELFLGTISEALMLGLLFLVPTRIVKGPQMGISCMNEPSHGVISRWRCIVQLCRDPYHRNIEREKT